MTITINNSLVKSFKPTDIPACELWLDANDTNTITFNGSNVSGWADKSGNGNNAIQPTSTNQPTYLTTGINNKGSLEFNGSSDRMVITSFANSVTQPNTIFIVATFDDVTVSHKLIDGYITTNLRNVLETTTTPEFQMWASNGVAGGTPVIDTTYLFNGRFNTASSILRINGIQVATGNAGANNLGTKGLTIGARYNFINFHDGKISEIIIYNDLLSDTEINEVENYLTNKWGV